MSRWCEARYLPNNFDAYYAFDHAGNPPIHLWTKQLKTAIPYNWFSIFEEAKRMQRWWIQSYFESGTMLNYYEKSPSSYEYSITATDHNSRLNGSKEDEGCEDVFEDKTVQRESTVALVSSNVIPFPDAIETQHDHTKYHTSLPRTSSLPSNRQDEALKKHNLPQNTVTDNEESIKPERKKLTNRKSWSSLFLKKEKSKKAQGESKKNVPREARYTLPAYATSREIQYADNIDFN
ncbi:uncharacterized protein RHIMIDRAFT_257763 [Rhizopus microsporus ATCC 52813]|uniref:Uncharacterized protein n=2 Tax=Rhizopus microsporus TaxID=58291 RepID=A0A2G4SRU9_RHIZD|nr:uncharacterized protein RHIMIDRAFT_257763 [Rhizopus microsporus ATCC 52813]PHZ11475.1 hypothetical protein RHIMIDRAFT_257763 [Rhizopus microsporus ATCC 52813]